MKVIITPIISIKLLGVFNIFEQFEFIPVERATTLGLTAYLGILEFIWFTILSWISSKNCKIKCVFSKAGESTNINSVPEITFKKDVAEIICNIDVSGSAKRLLKNSLEITFPEWVDIQVQSSNIIALQNNTYKINLGSMVDENDHIVENATCKFKICFIKNFSSEDTYSKTIIPKIKKRLGYTFEFNKFKFL